MKAFRLMEPGRTELVEIPTPRPDDGEVLIEVQSGAVCRNPSSLQ